MSNDFSRRKFLESIAIGGAASASLPLWANRRGGERTRRCRIARWATPAPRSPFSLLAAAAGS